MSRFFISTKDTPFILSFAFCFFVSWGESGGAIGEWAVASSPAPAASSAPQTPEAQELIRYLFHENEQPKRGGPRTDGFLLIQNGATLVELYGRGYDENKPHIMWSVSKTVTALLYGVALFERRIQLEQSICEIAKFPNSEFCAIKVRDVLQWTTSIRWLEEYEKSATPTQASVLAMLYGEGRRDMAHFVKQQPLEPGFEPGRLWRYSSGDSLLAGYLLGLIFKGQDLREVFRIKIAEPLGLKNWVWERDGIGTLAGAYYFNASARDLARIGQLLLGKGQYNKTRIFDESFWNFMNTVPDAFRVARVDLKDGNVSGGHLWLNRADVAGVPQPFPGLPEDTVAARGHWGQYLVVIPSLNAVVVRIGDTRDGSLSLPDLLTKTLPLLKKRPKVGAHGLPAKSVSGSAIPAGVFKSSNVEVQPWDLEFRQPKMALGAGFVAKSLCSCLYVSKLSENACRDYASLAQVSPRASIDRGAKSVTTSYFLFFYKRTAQYLGEERGCVLN
jgi:CubicO group peptidase (beta-lactamase class C family)